MWPLQMWAAWMKWVAAFMPPPPPPPQRKTAHLRLIAVYGRRIDAGQEGTNAREHEDDTAE